MECILTCYYNNVITVDIVCGGFRTAYFFLLPGQPGEFLEQGGTCPE